MAPGVDVGPVVPAATPSVMFAPLIVSSQRNTDTSPQTLHRLRDAARKLGTKGTELTGRHPVVLSFHRPDCGTFGAHEEQGNRPAEVKLVKGVVERDQPQSQTLGASRGNDQAISQRLLGTREIILIHHTDCGMLTFTDDEFKAEIEADTGLRPGWAPESFRDPAADVRQSLARIAANPFIPPKDHVRGFVYSVTDGSLTEIT